MWCSSRPPPLFISGCCLLMWMASRTFRGKYSISRSIIRVESQSMWCLESSWCPSYGVRRFECHIHLMFFEDAPTVSLRKFTEQSGWKSHNKENQTTVCDKWTLSFLIYKLYIILVRSRMQLSKLIYILKVQHHFDLGLEKHVAWLEWLETKNHYKDCNQLSITTNRNLRHVHVIETDLSFPKTETYRENYISQTT